jgi:arylsulfatase
MEPIAKNLVLVSYDSVRKDVAYAGPLRGLESLRAQGCTFTTCVSSAPLTPVSHASVMTGLQPCRHGIRHLFKERMMSGVGTLASTLHSVGYSTSAIVSCPGLNRWYGIDHGFEHYDDEIPPLPDGSDPLKTVDVKLRGQALKRAPIVVDRSLQYLSQNHREPCFHFIHFFDAHWPYEPPALIDGRASANPYEDEVRFLDFHFQRWLAEIRRRELLTDALIVLFADHGEDLAGWYPDDKGGQRGDHPEEFGHGCLLHDPTVIVPLVFSHPTLARTTIEGQVRLVDVMPTCLELLGVPIPSGLDGRSLARTIVDGAPPVPCPAYSETFYPQEQTAASGGKFHWARNKKSVRFPNNQKVIFHLESDTVEAYDLNSDPLEKRNLLGTTADSGPNDPCTPKEPSEDATSGQKEVQCTTT